MFNSQKSLSLLSRDGPQWNKDLMVELQAALDSNPAVDLLSIFNNQYRDAHLLAQSARLSELGRLNIRTLDELNIKFESDPEVDLSSVFPRSYFRKRGSLVTSKTAEPQHVIAPKKPDFRNKLDDVETASVVSPLSPGVRSLLLGREKCSPGEIRQDDLVDGLKRLIWNSPKLWECSVRGVVLKCNDDTVAKIIDGGQDYTEYSTLQYLAQNAPEIPAPRPYGLIAFGPCRVIFMSLIPGTTLSHAWPRLSFLQKSSIQQQLDNIFARLRTITKPKAQNLGGVCGEGAKELRVNGCGLFPDITTAAQYSELQWSAPNHGSKTYAKFLRSFWDARESSLDREVVFTHGDVRTDNIMVDMKPGIDGTNNVLVTAIIDWEDSGFYPNYYECTALTRTLTPWDENDWYLHLPDSISPLKYRKEWLVDRLWGVHLRTT
ncbi:phosphotransferase family protein [Pseudovirgaria hyperparasitica]|uniref:Phosphotransferase family protein n=1 Tax=Pseudovirgaria hyperparasitica TaxID=470096 RepID=A0A6A6VZ98_9PEZI|nr:phosphotransferase family protein [Pseudovirgaria hyperparasitica]KAF2754647.1 phosphotransferase family protein [Pseudovirgaria hyperparasitica]